MLNVVFIYFFINLHVKFDSKQDECSISKPCNYKNAIKKMNQINESINIFVEDKTIKSKQHILAFHDFVSEISINTIFLYSNHTIINGSYFDHLEKPFLSFEKKIFKICGFNFTNFKTSLMHFNCCFKGSILNCSFTDFYSKNSTHFFALNDTNLSIYDIEVKNCFLTDSTLFYANRSVLKLERCLFKTINNFNSKNNGIFYANNAEINCVKCSFNKIKSMSSPIMSYYQQSKITFVSCEFFRNIQYSILKLYDETILLMTNCKIRQNIGSAIISLSSFISFNDLHFELNRNSGKSFFRVKASLLRIDSNSKFKSNTGNNLFYLSDKNSSLIINATEFLNNQLIESYFNISNQCNLKLANSAILNNITPSPILKAETLCTIFFINTFFSNFGLIPFCLSQKSELTIKNCTFNSEDYLCCNLFQIENSTILINDSEIDVEPIHYIVQSKESIIIVNNDTFHTSKQKVHHDQLECNHCTFLKEEVIEKRSYIEFPTYLIFFSIYITFALFECFTDFTHQSKNRSKNIKKKIN